jgi:Methylamine utilisation protein MauE
MTVAVMLGRVVLAAVFGVAALAKLRDRAGTQRSLIAFGVPEWLASTAGVVLPVAELAVAASLVLAVPCVVSAGGAVALLALFTGAIAQALRRGRRPEIAVKHARADRG